jgi:hypothetical protein
MLSKQWLALSFVTAFLAVCTPGQAQVRGWIHLGSGDSLPLLGLARVAIPHDSALLALDYETQLPLTDTASLRDEVLQIWPSLRQLAEDQHFWAAAIRANRIDSETRDSSGHQTKTTLHAYGFVLRRNPEGGWHFLHDTTTIQ